MDKVGLSRRGPRDRGLLEAGIEAPGLRRLVAFFVVQFPCKMSHRGASDQCDHRAYGVDVDELLPLSVPGLGGPFGYRVRVRGDWEDPSVIGLGLGGTGRSRYRESDSIH